jgi:alkanesulfonate monooxygenase SsuD/methylene tetrahydromethanopterin reductase-like flavin-dependent oxidoreductase (luciferase family)
LEDQTERRDGIIYTGEISNIKTIVDAMKQFCAEAGRMEGEVQVVYRIPCSIAEKGSEAREEVKGKIARAAMTHLGRLHKMGKLEDQGDRRAVERLWQHYDTYHHMGPEHSHLVRDEWVDRFAVAGTPEQVRECAGNFTRRNGRADDYSLWKVQSVGDQTIRRRSGRKALAMILDGVERGSRLA